MPDMGDLKLAFDATVRSMDKDGRMHISKTHISKSTVNGYYGSEIPNSQALGLDQFKVYYMFRDPLELARAASTFARLPILSKHIPISADAHPAELVVGAIGSDVEFNEPYLDADVCIWENGAIAGIETDTVREFSCAYRYTPVMTAGEYHGQRYDGVMTEIAGNHLALVETGRAGSDVLAADEDTMKMTKLGKALFVTLGALSPKLAQDSALPALVGKASGKTTKVEELSVALVAMDAELDPKLIKGTVDALIALDRSVSGDPATSMDSDDDDDDKTAEDEEEDEEEKKKDKKAMDAAISDGVAKVRVEMREADEARRAVSAVVGDVITQDSASDIYIFALDEMKVEHKDVTGVPALRALFNLARTTQTTAPVVAMDSAGLAAQFPEASRFRQM
jgi:hypothetical protein